MDLLTNTPFLAKERGFFIEGILLDPIRHPVKFVLDTGFRR